MADNTHTVSVETGLGTATGEANFASAINSDVHWDAGTMTAKQWKCHNDLLKAARCLYKQCGESLGTITIAPIP